MLIGASARHCPASATTSLTASGDVIVPSFPGPTFFSKTPDFPMTPEYSAQAPSAAPAGCTGLSAPHELLPAEGRAGPNLSARQGVCGHEPGHPDSVE